MASCREPQFTEDYEPKSVSANDDQDSALENRANDSATFNENSEVALAHRPGYAREERRAQAWEALDDMPEFSRQQWMEDMGAGIYADGETDVGVAALAAADLPDATKSERWRTFKEAAGFPPTDAVLDGYLKHPLWEMETEAHDIASEFGEIGIDVSVGRDDPGAEYTILTAAPLMNSANESLLKSRSATTSGCWSGCWTRDGIVARQPPRACAGNTTYPTRCRTRTMTLPTGTNATQGPKWPNSGKFSTAG